MKDLRKMAPKPDPASFPTPLDSLLTAGSKLPFTDTTLHWQDDLFKSQIQQGGIQDNFGLQTAAHNASVDSGMGIPVSANHISLKPGAKECSKSEALHVIDFVSKAVEKEEKVLVDSNGTKLYLKGCPKKPTLESITVPQWVGASICIFNQLLESNKFRNKTEMLSYLCYMVKVMELAARFE